MSRKNLFITIEGVEGVGKSTIAKFIKNLLIKNHKKVTLSREPGGTYIAEKIRRIILDQESEPLLPISELLLFFASRAQNYFHLIKPSLEKGDFVVCDRFTEASYAYQGGGRGIPYQYIKNVEDMVQMDIKPDLTLILDASIETIQKRMTQRRSLDRIEQEKIEFFQRVKDSYLQMTINNPDRYKLINTDQSLEIVQTKIHHILMSKLSQGSI